MSSDSSDSINNDDSSNMNEERLVSEIRDSARTFLQRRRSESILAVTNVINGITQPRKNLDDEPEK